jgi:penicillin-binding protein 1C
VPAVAVLDKVGASRFAARLAQAGGATVAATGEVAGLAMGSAASACKLYRSRRALCRPARARHTVPPTTSLCTV